VGGPFHYFQEQESEKERKAPFRLLVAVRINPYKENNHVEQAH